MGEEHQWSVIGITKEEIQVPPCDRMRLTVNVTRNKLVIIADGAYLNTYQFRTSFLLDEYTGFLLECEVDMDQRIGVLIPSSAVLYVCGLALLPDGLLSTALLPVLRSPARKR